MSKPADDRFDRYVRSRAVLEDPYVELDLSHAGVEDADLAALGPALDRALAAMRAIEAGGLANADEQRMVGHFWLRAPGLAPTPAIEDAIAGAIAAVEAFAQGVHAGPRLLQRSLGSHRPLP